MGSIRTLHPVCLSVMCLDPRQGLVKMYQNIELHNGHNSRVGIHHFVEFEGFFIGGWFLVIGSRYYPVFLWAGEVTLSYIPEEVR